MIYCNELSIQKNAENANEQCECEEKSSGTHRSLHPPPCGEENAIDSVLVTAA